MFESGPLCSRYMRLFELRFIWLEVAKELISFGGGADKGVRYIIIYWNIDPDKGYIVGGVYYMLPIVEHVDRSRHLWFSLCLFWRFLCSLDGCSSGCGKEEVLIICLWDVVFTVAYSCPLIHQRLAINSHIYDYLIQFGSLASVSIKMMSSVHLIWLTFVRLLWKEINCRIFQQNQLVLVITSAL